MPEIVDLRSEGCAMLAVVYRGGFSCSSLWSIAYKHHDHGRGAGEMSRSLQRRCRYSFCVEPVLNCPTQEKG